MTTRARGVRGRAFAGSRQPRRAVFWDDTMVDTTLVNNGVVNIALDGGVPEDELKGLTAVRVIIRLSVQAAVASTSGLVSMGIYVVEGDALSAGALAEPQDSVDDAGWMFRLARQIWSSGADSQDASQFMRIREDIRSMRKYPGEDYQLTLTVVNHEAAGSMNMDGIVRTLFKRA